MTGTIVPASNIFIESALQGLQNVANPRGGVLVHCTGGRSRSAAMIIAYMMSTHGQEYDEAMAAYMRTREPDVWEAFSALSPGAFKADLFRLCILHKRGGVYIDASCGPLAPLGRILRGCATGDSHFVAARENDLPTCAGGLHNGFLAASAGHPLEVPFSRADSSASWPAASNSTKGAPCAALATRSTAGSAAS